MSRKNSNQSGVYDSDDSIVVSANERAFSERSRTISCSSSFYDDGKHANLRSDRPGFGSKLPPVLCILFTELCERLVYYGVAGNLLVFLTRMSIDSALASSIVLIFTGRWLHVVNLCQVGKTEVIQGLLLIRDSKASKYC